MSSLLGAGCCCGGVSRCICVPDADGVFPFEFGTPPRVRLRASVAYTDFTGGSPDNHGSVGVESSPFDLTRLAGDCQGSSTTQPRRIGQFVRLFELPGGAAAGFTRTGFYDPVAESIVPFPLTPTPGSVSRTPDLDIQIAPGSPDGLTQYVFLYMNAGGIQGNGAAWRVQFVPGGLPVVTPHLDAGIEAVRVGPTQQRYVQIGYPSGTHHWGAWTATGSVDQLSEMHFRVRSLLTGSFTYGANGSQASGLTLGDTSFGLDLELDGECEELGP